MEFSIVKGFNNSLVTVLSGADTRDKPCAGRG
jgi:hypothetical protein